MNSQLALSYPASYVGKEAWQRQLDALRTAVRHLGPKEVAFECDIGGTHLHDALAERDRKVWHGAWTHVVEALLTARRDDAVAHDLVRSIAESSVLCTPFQISNEVVLTPEEEAGALRRELLAFGSAGKAAVDRIRKLGGRGR